MVEPEKQETTLSGRNSHDSLGDYLSNLPAGVSPDVIRQHLDRICSSHLFARSARLRRFLRFTVDSLLEGHRDNLKEYVIGVHVFDRGDDFDPRTDAIVRTEATRLRRKLAEYYETDGRDAALVITIPRGGYVPLIQQRETRHTSPASGPTSTGKRRERRDGNRFPWVLVLGTVAIVAAAAIGWYFLGTDSHPQQALRSVPLTSYRGEEREPALSPSGYQVAFIWNGEHQDNFDVYIKLIAGGPPVRLTTDPAPERCPVWAPDGQQIAFVRPAETTAALFVIPALGGPERELTELSVQANKISWSPDGQFLAVEDQGAAGEPEGIFLVSVETGQKRRLTTPPAAYFSDRWPTFSPDGRALAFSRGRTSFGVYVLPLTKDSSPAREPQKLTREDLFLKGMDWTPDGQALVIGGIVDSGGWRLWKLDAGTRPTDPEPLQIGGESAQQPAFAHQQSGSETRLAYVKYFSENNIYRVSGPGAQEAVPIAQQPATAPIIGSSRNDTAPRFSPLGDRIALVSDRTGSFEVWVANIDGSNPVPITFFDGPSVGSPRWSPDGRRIAFDASPDGHSDVYVVSADSGVPRQLTADESNEIRPSWSRDGRWIYFTSDRGGPPEIRKMPAEGGSSVQITRNRGLEAFASPDGRWVYYAKHYAGRGDIGIWRIPVEGGEEELVQDEGVAGRWALSQSGIYHLNPGGPDRAPAIELFRFDTKERTTIVELPTDARFGTANSIAVSADECWISYVKFDQTEADLMLVENFR